MELQAFKASCFTSRFVTFDAVYDQTTKAFIVAVSIVDLLRF